MSLLLTTKKIINDWTDYNGHMNLAFYILVFDKGAEDLRTGSDVKLDDGKTIKVTQKNAKIINMALDRVKPQMRVQLIKLLGKNKQSFMKTLGAIKRSMA